MEIKVFPVHFTGNAQHYDPADRPLHDMVMEFAAKELAAPINLTEYGNVWAAVLCDDKGKYRKVVALACGVVKYDIAVFRSILPEASDKLIERVEGALADLGHRGKEVTIFLSGEEPEETKCPQYKTFLDRIGAKPGHRYVARVP